MYIFGCVSIWAESSSSISQFFCHGDKMPFISGKIKASKIYFGSGFQVFFSPMVGWFQGFGGRGASRNGGKPFWSPHGHQKAQRSGAVSLTV